MPTKNFGQQNLLAQKKYWSQKNFLPIFLLANVFLVTKLFWQKFFCLSDGETDGETGENGRDWWQD